MRWPVVVLMWLVGAVMVLYGALVEVEVRRNVGTGMRKSLAEALFAGDIAVWRDHSALWLIVGSLLVIGGLVLVRRGDPVRQARRCQNRADRAAERCLEAKQRVASANTDQQRQVWSQAAERAAKQQSQQQRKATAATKVATQRYQAIKRELDRAKRSR